MKKFFSNEAGKDVPLWLDWDNKYWCAYFFAEVSALAYHDGTRAKRELKQLGFKQQISIHQGLEEIIETIN